MRAFISYLLLIVLCVLVFVLPANAETLTEPELTMGDVDTDGRVTAVDALVVLQFTVFKYDGIFTNPPLPDKSDELYSAYYRYYHFVERFLADVDGDGLQSSKDALHILKYVVGKIDQFPVTDITQATNYDQLPAWPGDVQ